MKRAEDDNGQRLRDFALAELGEGKAEDIVSLDIRPMSALADTLIIASGRSQRHVSALAARLVEALRHAGLARPSAEGVAEGQWALVDAGAVIIHIFHPEYRAYYRLEELWRPKSGQTGEGGAIDSSPAYAYAKGSEKERREI